MSTATARRLPNVAETVAALDPAWHPPEPPTLARPEPQAEAVPPISEAEVLDAIRDGAFRVDLDTGEVTTASGRRLVPFSNRTDRRRFVRLHMGGRRRGIAVARLVWMAATMRLIPEGFEIHHEDEDCGNDARRNLICLHPDDHRKVHGQAVSTEEVPF